MTFQKTGDRERFGALKVNCKDKEAMKYLHAVQCTLVSKEITQRVTKKHMHACEKRNISIQLKGSCLN